MIEVPITVTRTAQYLTTFGGPVPMLDGNSAPRRDENGLYLYSVPQYFRNPNNPNDAFMIPVVVKSDGTAWAFDDMKKQVLGTADTLEIMDAISKMDAATSRVGGKVTANRDALSAGQPAVIDNVPVVAPDPVTP